MDAREVNRYLELVDRRLFILVHSGIDWKPEYETELETIDKELVGLRELVDQEHEKKERMDVIKEIKSYPYYHSMTGQSREEWAAWRVQAVDEWMLDKKILEKGEEEDGKEADSDRKGCHGNPGGVRVKGIRNHQTDEPRACGPGLHSGAWKSTHSLL